MGRWLRDQQILKSAGVALCMGSISPAMTARKSSALFMANYTCHRSDWIYRRPDWWMRFSRRVSTRCLFTAVAFGRAVPILKSVVRAFFKATLLISIFARMRLEGVEAVIHCAGLAGTWGAFDKYYDANVAGTENLLSAARTNRCRRFINISSPSIYFEFRDQLDLKEDYRPKKFSNAYARTKWMAETLVQAANSAELQTVLPLRPRSVIGASDQNVLPRLIRLQETGSLVQIGRGENVVDITTVGNLIQAVELCLMCLLKRWARSTTSRMGNRSNFGSLSKWC